MEFKSLKNGEDILMLQKNDIEKNTILYNLIQLNTIVYNIGNIAYDSCHQYKSE